MNQKLIVVFCATLSIPWAYAQETKSPGPKEQPLYNLIDQYAQARETKDTLLLEQILTEISTSWYRPGNGAGVLKRRNKGCSEVLAPTPVAGP